MSEQLLSSPIAPRGGHPPNLGRSFNGAFYRAFFILFLPWVSISQLSAPSQTDPLFPTSHISVGRSLTLSGSEEFFALLTSAVQSPLIWCLNEAPCCDGERIVLIRPGRSPNFPNRWTGVEKEFFAKFSLFVWQTAVRRIIRKKFKNTSLGIRECASGNPLPSLPIF